MCALNGKAGREHEDRECGGELGRALQTCSGSALGQGCRTAPPQLCGKETSQPGTTGSLRKLGQLSRGRAQAPHLRGLCLSCTLGSHLMPTGVVVGDAQSRGDSRLLHRYLTSYRNVPGKATLSLASGLQGNATYAFRDRPACSSK